MLPRRRARVPLLVPLLAGLVSGSCGPGEGSGAAQRSDTGIELFVHPRKRLYVEPGMPLAELLERYTQHMGWSLHVPEAARAKLAARHCDLSQRIEVPFDHVHGFVESLVRASGLLLRFEHRSEPVVLQLVDPADKETGDVPANRMLVPLAELPRWEAHPAHMISVQAPLPAGDPVTLVWNLRAVFGESARGVVQRTGDMNSILFSGTGTDVARLVRVIDEAARPAQPGTLAWPMDFPPWIELLHAPAQGLQLGAPSTDGLPLEALLERYAQLMGWHLLADDDVRREIKELRLDTRLPLDVPPGNVHAFVESVARANRLLFEFAHAAEPVLLRVTIAVDRVDRPRPSAMPVACEELPRWAEHTDFLIRTRFDLPGVDTSAHANVLQLLFSDDQRHQILPIGANGLLVAGYANEVAGLWQVLRGLVDEASGAKVAPPPPMPFGAIADVFVVPANALHLDNPEHGDLRLSDLVQQYTQLMGWRALYAPDTRRQLQMLKCGFALPLDVPQENVHAFVEGILRANDFVLGFAHTRDPVLLDIKSINVAGRGNARADALRVPPSELPRWADHPGFLISTSFELPGIDVRTLSNSLRQMFSDQQTQQIIPLGNTDSLLVTGFAADTARIAASLRALSDTTPGGRATLPPISPAPSGIELLGRPAKGLRFEKLEGRQLKLIDLFEQYTQLLGWRLLAEPDSRNQLKHLDCGFATPLDVPPENVHAFVEGLARSSEFVMTFNHTRDPVLLEVSSLRVAGKGNPRKDANFVPAPELQRWADHPAFLITTLVELAGTDVRTLSNSLRQMFSDQQTQQIIPVGNSDGLIVTGFASDVVRLISSLGQLGRGAEGLKPPSLPAAPLADRARLFPLGGTSFTIAAPAGKDATPLDLLEELARWTNRPLDITEDARKALSAAERRFAEPRVVPAQLAYPCVGLLLERARCTLSPVPQTAPVKWVVDVARGAQELVAQDLPTIAFEEIGSWSSYCATPFCTYLKLPDGTDAKQLDSVLKIVAVGGLGCRVDIAGKLALRLCGTPLEVQATAYAILQACEPAPDKR